MGERLIAKIVLNSDQHPRAGQAKHLRDGADVSSSIKQLQIVQFHGADGFYLYYLDESGELLNDTFHTTLEAAKEQAAFEFNVRNSDW